MIALSGLHGHEQSDVDRGSLGDCQRVRDLEELLSPSSYALLVSQSLILLSFVSMGNPKERILASEAERRSVAFDPWLELLSVRA